MYKRIILTACVIFLSASGILCLNFHWRNFYSNRISDHEINQWLGDDRPTLIYALPKARFQSEVQEMITLLLTAKKMGWNLISEQASHELPSNRLKNAFGLFQFNSRINHRIPTKNFFPQNIPLVIINNFIERELFEQNGFSLDKLVDRNPFYQDPRLIGILAVSYPLIKQPLVKRDLIKNASRTEKMSPATNIQFLMNWYPTSYTTYLQPHPTTLTYFRERLTDKVLTSKKYLNLWNQLETQNYFRMYGDPPHENYKSLQYPASDGKSLLQEINKNGIYLTLHTEPYLKQGVPTGRIFEAAAAAALIISDRHPFVEREFKDTVLYIDENREDLFEQIDAHMQWIKLHPEEATQKARLAHAIFLQKFTQEQQLARLYEYIQKYRNETNENPNE